MASKIRVEFVRFRSRQDSILGNIFDVSDKAPVTKAVSGTALTGAGRILVPASVNGYTKFHARIISDVETLVTFAPPADAGTSYDAAAGVAGGMTIPANQAVHVPVVPGMLISAATGLSFA